MRSRIHLPTGRAGPEARRPRRRSRWRPLAASRVGAGALALLIAATTSAREVRAQEPAESVALPHTDEVRTGQGYMVLADRRVFATMSFLNAVGYDHEQEGQEMHPLRTRVRQEVADRLASHPAKLEGWKARYEELRYPVWVFVEFSLMMSPDYPFRQVYPASHSQYERAVASMAGFPAVLNDFWKVADLGELWEEVKAEYLAELDRYDFEEMSRQMATLWAYLRMPRQDDYVLVNVPNPLDARFTGIGARFGPFYYQVESAGASSYALNMHEYLHSVVNPLVGEHFPAARAKLVEYYEAGKDGRYAQSYQSPLAMARESLTRALDYRLRVELSDDPEAGEKARARIAEITAGGLTPTGPFYDLLEERYEKDGVSFADYVPVLFEELPAYVDPQPLSP